MFVPEDEAAEVREENSVSEVLPESGRTPAEEAPYAREPVYSDAHYEPAGESTVPPRYYTPPERPVREPKPKKEKGGFGWIKAICVALAAALLGGFLGASLMGRNLNERIDELEQSLSESNQSIGELAQIQQENQAKAEAAEPEGLSPAQIYDRSCQQVVGISTEVTYTNFFGMTTSVPVSGSGFILSEDGYILTNYHVIEEACKGRLPITVMTRDGTQYEASIVGTEEFNDVAVLKVEASGLTPVAVGDSDTLSVGDTIYAVGNPMGELEFSMSTGHVSALDRVISTSDSESISMFQIDAAVNPGNSGGPVYNERGEAVGIVTAKYSDTGVEGLGFAIPINDAFSIADDLINKGYVTGKAYLGVWLDERFSATFAEYFSTPMGAYVSAVDPGSCAEKAGLRAGDIITRLDEKDITGFAELKSAVHGYSAGDEARITYYRAGESVTVTVIFDEAKPAATAAAAP